jgi:hypothetical protein
MNETWLYRFQNYCTPEQFKSARCVYAISGVEDLRSKQQMNSMTVKRPSIVMPSALHIMDILNIIIVSLLIYDRWELSTLHRYSTS